KKMRAHLRPVTTLHNVTYAFWRPCNRSRFLRWSSGEVKRDTEVECRGRAQAGDTGVPIRSAATAVTLAAGTDSRQLQAELLTCFVIRVDPCSSVANICSLGFAFARAKRFGHR